MERFFYVFRAKKKGVALLWRLPRPLRVDYLLTMFAKCNVLSMFICLLTEAVFVARVLFARYTGMTAEYSLSRV